jgi:hypothetical protein
MNMRDQIEEDFGKVLNIGEGSFSGEKQSPVTVLDEDVGAATATAVEFLRCIGIAFERTWKIVSIEPVEVDGTILLKLAIEAITMSERQMFDDQLNYYFACLNFKLNCVDIISVPFVGRDEHTRFPLPLSLSWAKFDRMVENKPSSMGVSYSYHAVTFTMGIYVYDKGVVNVGNTVTEAVRDEFIQNIVDVKEVHPEYELYGDEAALSDFLIQEFLSDSKYSVLAITAVNNHFIKLRITANAEKAMERVVHDVVEDFRVLANMARQT